MVGEGGFSKVVLVRARAAAVLTMDGRPSPGTMPQKSSPRPT